MRAKNHLIALVLGLLALAMNAEARVYTVTLENGTTFETRYPPTVFEDDSDVTRLLTDRGNWIALKTSEIADVESRADEDGFGREIDTTTRFLGWIMVEETLVEETSHEADGSVDPPRYELPEPPDPWTYSIERFLQPNAVSPTDSLNGIPLDLYGDDVYDGYFYVTEPVPDPAADPE